MTPQELELLQAASDKLTDYLNSTPAILDICINDPAPDSQFGKEFSDESAMTAGSIAAMYLHVGVQHLAFVHAAINSDKLVLLPIVNVVRATMEAASRAHWLLDPSLDMKQRVARGLLERIAALESQQGVRRDAKHLAARGSEIRATALHHGISLQGRRSGSGLPKKVGGETRPDNSALVAAALSERGKQGVSSSTAGWLYAWMSAYSHSAIWTAIDMRSVRTTSAGTHQIAVTADARHIGAALILGIEVHKAAVRRLAVAAGRPGPPSRSDESVVARSRL
jgi:hypothetical protein